MIVEFFKAVIMLKSPLLNLAVRLIVGFIFILAAAGKIAEPAQFAKEIANYQILPLFTVNIVALILPWLELVVAILLMLGIRIKANATLISAMLVFFILAIAAAMVRGLNIDCGCFSNSDTLVGWRKIFEDLGLLMGSLYLIFFPAKKYTLENIIKNDLLQQSV